MKHALTDDEIHTIRERHYGWERATPKLLADVFGVSVQRITAVLAMKLDPRGLDEASQ
jgi:hypothetical protein